MAAAVGAAGMGTRMVEVAGRRGAMAMLMEGKRVKLMQPPLPLRNKKTKPKTTLIPTLRTIIWVESPAQCNRLTI